MNKNINVLSLFSGVGAFECALENLKIKYNLIGFSEINKYAIKVYNNLHNEGNNKNLGDIKNINIEKLPENIDIIFHGSPCQDFSVAGNNKGGDEGSKTRSSLMWFTVDIIKHCKPKYIIWENVKNVLSKKHKHNFDKYLKELEYLGYKNYHSILNSKDYNIPQNRERIFVISIKEGPLFKFPNKEKPTNKIIDFINNKVDEKYYIKDDKIEKNYKINNYKKPIANKIIDVERIPLKFLNRNGKKTDNDYIFCIDTCNTGGIKEFYNDGFRIRRLTPYECFRFQGFNEQQINIIKNCNISDTQLYILAGNTITVKVIEKILKNLLQ